MATDLPQTLLRRLEQHGYDFFTGVPCSYLEGLTRVLDADVRYGYVSAVREDSALGIAAGAYLGGRQPVVLMQNSGLGVSINTLASLNYIYRIPALLLITWRGEDGLDAPEHLVMGDRMQDLLRLLAIPFEVFDPAALEEQLTRLTYTLRKTERPVAWIVRKGVLS